MKNKFLSLFAFTMIATTACNIFPSKVDTTAFKIDVTNKDTFVFIPDKVHYSTIRMGYSIESIPQMMETTFSLLPSLDVLDSEDTDYTIGKNEDGYLYFFKCTFYMKNIGTGPAEVEMEFLVNNNSKEKNSSSLTDTLRVMIFDNDANSDEHNYKVYAKEAAGTNYDRYGNATNQEFIAYGAIGQKEDDQHLLAESFSSEKVVYKNKISNFTTSDFRRYTVVSWFEGEDPQSSANAAIPTTETLNFRVNIIARNSK